MFKDFNNGLSKEKEKEREWHKKALIFIRYTFNATEESMILDMSCLGPGKLATDKTSMDIDKFELKYPNASKKKLSRKVGIIYTEQKVSTIGENSSLTVCRDIFQQISVS